MTPGSERDKSSNRLRRYLFLGILLAVSFTGMEGAIRLSMLLVPNNPLVEIAFDIPDGKLRYRLNPNYPGHDQNGFRNKIRLPKADLVVLGDSQAYGFGIPLEQLWPQRIGDLTGTRAYNMGVPGYGPVESLFLLEGALDLAPAVVIEGFYSGNDLYDAFRLAYYVNDLKDLKSTEPDRVAAIAEWEKRRLLSDLIDEVYYYRRQAKDSGELARAKVWLNAHVMVYRLLRTVRDRLIAGTEAPKRLIDNQADAERYPKDLLASGPGMPGTIFTPRYRFAALDLEDPRIGEGLAVSLRAIERMARRVAEKGACFAVALIPTKEYVYGEAGDAPTSNVPSRETLRLLLGRERTMWDRVRKYFEERGIAYVDVRPALSQRVRRGDAMYPASTDGHPTAAGHDVIARAVVRSGVCGLRERSGSSPGAASN